MKNYFKSKTILLCFKCKSLEFHLEVIEYKKKNILPMIFATCKSCASIFGVPLKEESSKYLIEKSKESDEKYEKTEY